MEIIADYPIRDYSNITKSTVYIDEAGDLGMGVGTKWFVLSAVIVDNIDEPNIRAKITKLKQELNVNEIHIRKIQDFNKRAHIVNTLRNEKFTFINVIADTELLDKTKMSSTVAYNYLCRYLIERVSWYLRDTNRIADIVLSARGTARDNELIEYIKKLQVFDGNTISNMFLKVQAKSSSQWDLLQLADVCATSMFLYHQYNRFGLCTPCYTISLYSHLYRRNGNILKYGIKYFNDNMKPDATELKPHWICNK